MTDAQRKSQYEFTEYGYISIEPYDLIGVTLYETGLKRKLVITTSFQHGNSKN